MAAIKQIQVAYDAVQDRLLTRLNTDTGQEFRIWLTRRALAALWQPLCGALGRQEAVVTQPSAVARDAVLSFRHEQAVAQANFGGEFESRPQTAFPLGSEPLLAARIVVRAAPRGGLQLGFAPAEGQGVNVQLGEQLAHGLVRLLVAAHEKAAWGLDLSLTRRDAAPELTGAAVH